jgi:hypothetical protein
MRPRKHPYLEAILPRGHIDRGQVREGLVLSRSVVTQKSKHRDDTRGANEDLHFGVSQNLKRSQKISWATEIYLGGLDVFGQHRGYILGKGFKTRADLSGLFDHRGRRDCVCLGLARKCLTYQGMSPYFCMALAHR